MRQNFGKRIGFDTIAVAFDSKHIGSGKLPLFYTLNESVPCLTKPCNPYSKSNAST